MSSPIVKVVRWTLPWVLFAVVAWYLWGFYTEFQTNARTTAATYVSPEQAALLATSSANATASISATSVPTGMIGKALVDGVRLRTTPSANGQVTASVGKGTTLVLLEKRKSWYRVRDPLGHVGWVTASDKFIEIVKK